MARNSTIACTDGAWTLVTDGPVSALRLQNIGTYMVMVQATAGAAPPAEGDAGGAGALQLERWQAIPAGVMLSDLFPGVIAGAGYVWVRGEVPARVSVSHA